MVAVAVPMIDPAGQALAANWGLVQTLPMWPLSSSRVAGIVTAVRAMLASPGSVLRVARRAGLPVRLVDPLQRQGELRREGHVGAVGDLEVGALV